MTGKRFKYTGPLTAGPVCEPDGEVREKLLHPGQTYTLPADHPRVAELARHLSAVAEEKPADPGRPRAARKRAVREVTPPAAPAAEAGTHEPQEREGGK